MTVDNLTKNPIRVEIWADVQCVWCYIGDARWKEAIAQFDGQVEVVHRSFELQPGAPVDFDAQTYLQSQRGMTPEDQDRVFGGIIRAAAVEGLVYDPIRMQPTNSHLALELLHHADANGRREQMSDRLFSAYFAEGRHIGRLDDLVALAAEAGLDTDQSRHALTVGTYRTAVDEDHRRAGDLGAQGVPFYVLNDSYGISGAQSTDAFVAALAATAA